MSGKFSVEATALVESWLREVCPETISTKGVHLFAKICELSVYNFRDTGTLECHPGRAYLGRLVGWSVTKVSRLTSKLKKFGTLVSRQPRLLTKDGWITLTNVYTVPLLTKERVRQLARLLGVDLRAHMPSRTSQSKKKEIKACVRPVIPLLKKWMERGRGFVFPDFSFLKNEGRRATLERFARLGECSAGQRVMERG
jgi:hypothetical protein